MTEVIDRVVQLGLINDDQPSLVLVTKNCYDQNQWINVKKVNVNDNIFLWYATFYL